MISTTSNRVVSHPESVTNDSLADGRSPIDGPKSPNSFPLPSTLLKKCHPTSRSIIIKIIASRRDRNLTQNKLADICNINHSTVARMEAFESSPSLDNVSKILEQLDLSLVVMSSSDYSDYLSIQDKLSKIEELTSALETLRSQNYLLTEENIRLRNSLKRISKNNSPSYSSNSAYKDYALERRDPQKAQLLPPSESSHLSTKVSSRTRLALKNSKTR